MSWSWVRTDEGICGGEPRIAGTRITVRGIKALAKAGHPTASILNLYPELTTEGIEAALAYNPGHNFERFDRPRPRRKRDCNVCPGGECRSPGAAAEPVCCICTEPDPDAIGECRSCRRLVVTPEVEANAREWRLAHPRS